MFNPKSRLEKRSKVELETGNDEMPDFTEKVPKDVLIHILTFLPLDEAIRSGILSKKWKDLWRNVTHIEFDEKKLIKPLLQLLLSRKSGRTKDVTKGTCWYALLLHRIMFRHYGDLLSFRILHSWETILFREVQSWVKYVLITKKGVQNLSLECEPDNGEMGERFLFQYNIPKLNFSNGIFQRLEGYAIVKGYEILAHSAMVYSSNIIFKNLSTLSMDLDLNHIRDAQDLYSVLQLCTSLQVLEISLPDFENTIIGSSNDYDFPYPISMFWEKQELCYCVHEKLKFVYIKAFKGNELEVEFVKYLIAKATMMKKVTIFCNTLTEDAENLLSLPKTSTNLSINFKVNAINIMN
ncbi:hypothetical protein TanjilG_09994 [Lupinus angustifolius]|uniref:FBD domain-containing protein n=1 Tax=Lupinus angustifolius TaxID=3871 RepID=A0A1J7GKG4_LUPAN|nr:hypothetical protein TanjilG_09994 [Lupinus angustifolius]